MAQTPHHFIPKLHESGLHSQMQIIMGKYHSKMYDNLKSHKNLLIYLSSSCRNKPEESKDRCVLTVHGKIHTDGPSRKYNMYVMCEMIEIQIIEGG